MKNKKALLFSLIKICADTFVAVLMIFVISFFTVTPMSFHGELAEADGFENAGLETEKTYPYVKTFTISAYYSPLPCQNRYATGSYAGDIRLNGSGVRGADGTPVYPGMIAAPRTYPFGTKMDIPGVGIVAVHDRGGAIVASDREGVFDRLDIWMGYGDKGLTRALNWGKRNLEVVVYGKNDSIMEQIVLEGYSPQEAIPNQCVQPTEPEDPVAAPPVANPPVVNPPSEEVSIGKFGTDLKIGDSGTDVISLQQELTNLNFFRTAVTGYYGPVTEHAVFKFQQSQGLVAGKDSHGAGVFGPATRNSLNSIVTSRNYNSRLIVDATNEYRQRLAGDASSESAGGNRRIISKELDFGQSDPEVSTLQSFLKEKGFFEGFLVTEYYGPITREAVIRFQLANRIILSRTDSGAGRVGPATMAFINEA